MSKLNRRAFKELLAEWKQNFINEVKVVSLDELLNDMLNSESYSEEDVRFLEEFWINPSHQFISKYSQVIKNDISMGEPIEHILSDIKIHYHKIYQSASPKSKSEIGLGNISVDDLRKQIDVRSNFNSREIRQQCEYREGRPVTGTYRDFDVVYSKSDYIVIEPRTTAGSIAWSHGKPDGSEEVDPKRRVGWCTATSTGNNMFPNYAGNLHMFYVIRSDYENNKTSQRRICLSFVVKNGTPELERKGGSTVDAMNRTISESDIDSIRKETYYSLIIERLRGRKNTAFNEVYAKTSVSQFQRMFPQILSQDVNESIKHREIRNYLKHSHDKFKISKILLNHSDPRINIIAIKYSEVELSAEEVKVLFERNNPEINIALIQKRDLNIEHSKELINDIFWKGDSNIIHQLLYFWSIDISEELFLHLLEKHSSRKPIIDRLFNLDNVPDNVIDNVIEAIVKNQVKNFNVVDLINCVSNNEILKKLFDEYNLTSEVASSPMLQDQELITKIYEENLDDLNIIKSLSKNQNLPKNIFEDFLFSHDESIQGEVIQNNLAYSFNRSINFRDVLRYIGLESQLSNKIKIMIIVSIHVSITKSQAKKISLEIIDNITENLSIEDHSPQFLSRYIWSFEKLLHTIPSKKTLYKIHDAIRFVALEPPHSTSIGGVFVRFLKYAVEDFRNQDSIDLILDTIRYLINKGVPNNHFAQTRDKLVRMKNCSEKTLDELSSIFADNAVFLKKVIKHENVTADILRKLSKSGDKKISKLAKTRLSLIETNIIKSYIELILS